MFSGEKRDDSSDVEELLRAAEDETLLNLSIHSHTSASSPLDTDLARRFEALKMPMPSSSPNITKAPLPPPKKEEKREQISSVPLSSLEFDENLKTILGADLSSRFAALKKTTSSSSPSSSSFPAKDSHGSSGKFNDYDGEDEEDDDDIDGEGVSKKEVDKLIQWAMDAARLDPSVGTDDDDDDNVDDDEEEKKKEKKNKKKKKKDQK